MTEKPRKPRSPIPTSNTIAFRADEELLAKIDQSAQDLGMTRGEFVRAAMVMHFEARPAAIAEKLAALSKALSLVRRNQPRLLVTLLTEIGKLPIDQAKEIARITLVS